MTKYQAELAFPKRKVSFLLRLPVSVLILLLSPWPISFLGALEGWHQLLLALPTLGSIFLANLMANFLLKPFARGPLPLLPGTLNMLRLFFRNRGWKIQIFAFSLALALVIFALSTPLYSAALLPLIMGLAVCTKWLIGFFEEALKQRETS